MTDITNLALIMAAGRGTRAGGGVPKVYRALPNGRNVLATGLERFLAHEQIHAVLPVIHKDDVELYDMSIKELNNKDKLLDFVTGGASRQHSVANGLQAAQPYRPKQILVHDAARPYVSAALITRCLAGLGSAAAAIPAVAPRDTLKRAENGIICETLPREAIWLAQTPQAFHFGALLAAYQQVPQAFLAQATDDAAIAELAGLQIALVAGEESNIKLTFEADFAPATALLPRTGTGFDVHRLGAEGSATQIMLCGVAIAHNQALIGHSDADVGLHALTDALLGALAAGDIGDHFPPSDPRHKARPSSEFLAHAVGLARQSGARLCHADITLICEAPKIAPYRDAMRQTIATLLDLPISAVSVKATTTEGLGALGRGEGIAAQATINLLMPPARHDAAH